MITFDSTGNATTCYPANSVLIPTVDSPITLVRNESDAASGIAGDTTSAITNREILLQRIDTTGSLSFDTITYPIVQFGTVGTDTIVYDSNVTTGALSIGSETTYWSDEGYSWRLMTPRIRGETLHRQNHRGLRPRALDVNFSTATPAEITALQLLRHLVGSQEFRRYLKYGFVMVRGRSGLRYQIRRCQHVVHVWNDRRRVDGICVWLKGSFPPTDAVITRMLMAERDELELWRRGNSRLGRNASIAGLERLRETKIAV